MMAGNSSIRIRVTLTGRLMLISFLSFTINLLSSSCADASNTYQCHVSLCYIKLKESFVNEDHGGTIRMGRRKARSQDVALRAGVSRTTVSLVLNHHDDAIPEQTRKKVLQAAKELGFVPSAAARTLRKGRGSIVLCLTVNAEPSSRADEAWSSLSEKLHDRGLTCIFSRTAGSTTPLRQLLWEVTPSVVVPFFDLSKADKVMLRQMGIPIVEFFKSQAEGETNGHSIQLFTDFQVQIGETQATYLLKKGCTKIAYVGTATPSSSAMMNSRRVGVQTALSDAGLKLVSDGTISLHDNNQSAASMVKRLKDEGCDGICAFNDEHAAAIMAQAQEQGVEIPKVMRIIGVDNEPISAYLQPALTSVDYDSIIPEYLDIIIASCNSSVGQTLVKRNDTTLWVVERQSA